MKDEWNEGGVFVFVGVCVRLVGSFEGGSS